MAPAGTKATKEDLAGAMSAFPWRINASGRAIRTVTLRQLEHRGLVALADGEYRITDAGLQLAKQLMDRATNKCRTNSKLPELVDLFLSRPLVTVPLGAKLLKVPPKAVDLMLLQLGGALPRELTGRRRYRARGIA
jgi:hypothetical protein